MCPQPNYTLQRHRYCSRTVKRGNGIPNEVVTKLGCPYMKSAQCLPKKKKTELFEPLVDPATGCNWSKPVAPQSTNLSKFGATATAT